MNEITVITYNILSQPLAELLLNEKKQNQSIYRHEHIDHINRWTLLTTKLTNMINTYNNPIICLQEVPEQWLILFKYYFQNVKYKYINTQYGNKFNGNMGCLIAYPDNFVLERMEICQIANEIEQKQLSVTPSLQELFENDIVMWSKTKKNTAIFTIFNFKHIRIGVITYHMPCEYKYLSLMYLHINALHKKAESFMNGTSYIIAGDLNLTPTSIIFKQLTQQLRCVWNIKNIYPDTNHSYLFGNEFNGCIDHIFYKDLTCIDVICNSPKNIIPDINEPSDHVPVIATFLF